MKLRRDEPSDLPPFDESPAPFAGVDDIDPVDRGSDLSVTQQRIENARARRARQGRRFLQGLAVFVVLFVVIARWRSPQEPQLTVAWPSQALGSSTLPNGTTILMRGGQPFTVTISDAKAWNVSWNWNGGEGEGVPMRWAPSGNTDLLQLKCRARPVGAQWLWSWLWPTRVLVLQGTSPVPLGGKRFVVVPLPGAPIRISSRVVATQNASSATEARWHENALPLLESAARNKALKSGATWTIVPSSDAKTPARDDSTYVALSPSSFTNPVEALTQCALQIEKNAPKADIKWIARLQPNNGVPRALLWLDFGTRRKIGARGGWVVQNGNSVATTQKWWRDE